MNVSGIGSNQAMQSLATLAQSRVAKPSGGEANETSASEAAESPQAQVSEGEAGSIINTHA